MIRSKSKKAAEDPVTKFKRLIDEAMSKGMAYTEAVRFIDQIDPTLRQRANELATARRNVGQQDRSSVAAAWRKKVQSRGSK
jgi:hypothetical protein